MNIVKILISLMFIATPVTAQEMAFVPEATEICVADAAEAEMPEDCIGRSANQCMSENGADGSTTVGMGYCLTRELEYWDQRLNTAYRSVRDVDQVYDAELAELGSAAPNRAAALRDMQRAWIGYRDAACVYEYSAWGGGTGGGPAHAACMMRITGVQALRLETTLKERR